MLLSPHIVRYQSYYDGGGAGKGDYPGGAAGATTSGGGHRQTAPGASATPELSSGIFRGLLLSAITAIVHGPFPSLRCSTENNRWNNIENNRNS